MGNHSGSRLRRGLARHKKVAIVAGSALGFAAAAGIAFAMVAGGGLFSGSASLGGPSATATADLQWQTVISSSCSSTPITGGGNTSSTFHPTTTISSDGSTLDINATNGTLYDGDHCTGSVNVKNTGNTETTITGASFSVGGAAVPASDITVDADTGSGIFAAPPATVSPGETVTVDITVTVPAGTPASSTPVSFTGHLVTT